MSLRQEYLYVVTYIWKDQNAHGIYGGGHNHDWENIVVFTEGDNIIRVAPSAHGGYAASNEFPTDGTSPLIVYQRTASRTTASVTPTTRTSLVSRTSLGSSTAAPWLAGTTGPRVSGTFCLRTSTAESSLSSVMLISLTTCARLPVTLSLEAQVVGYLYKHISIYTIVSIQSLKTIHDILVRKVSNWV